MPLDRGVIDAQLREIGEGERWWDEREFRDLPHALNADERIHGLVLGRLLGPRRPRLLPAARWLVVATDQRLLCLQQERFGRKQVDVRLDQVTGIRHGARLGAYQVTVETPQRRYRIRIPKADAFRFLRALAPLMPPAAGQPVGAASWLPGIDAVAALPGLSGLASRVGVLPAPEYASRGDLARVEGTVERMEKEIERLQQQVEFLENLLQERPGSMFALPGRAGRGRDG